MKYSTLGLLLVLSTLCHSQIFIRYELPTELDTPWEIEFGPDQSLWITEAGGKVVRIDPADGDKQEVYAAADYFEGDLSEANPYCPNKEIGHGTYGLALHPDFLDPIQRLLISCIPTITEMFKIQIQNLKSFV